MLDINLLRRDLATLSSPGSTPARIHNPFSTSRSFSALENERKTLQTRTEELQAQAQRAVQADRPAARPGARTPAPVMAEVGGIGRRAEGQRRAVWT